MDDKKNKNLWISLAVILVIVVGLILWSMLKSTPASAPATIDEDSTTKTDTPSGDTNTNSPAVSISYTNALVKYKDARLQFDNACQASPDKMTFKNNSYMMIDNRASVSRSIKIGSVYSVGAYGFKIIKLSSATLPATWYVDCGKSQNVATILIQK
ncbi:MAG: hypothetical protein WC870_00285 [Candidatus Paceibacterota bacterium]